MRVQFLLALLSSTTLLATAIPQASITPPSSYYLQSHVVVEVGVGEGDDDDGTKHEKRGDKYGLWVSCYQTGTERKKTAFHSGPFFFPLSLPPSLPQRESGKAIKVIVAVSQYVGLEIRPPLLICLFVCFRPRQSGPDTPTYRGRLARLLQ